MSELEVF